MVGPGSSPGQPSPLVLPHWDTEKGEAAFSEAVAWQVDMASKHENDCSVQVPMNGHYLRAGPCEWSSRAHVVSVVCPLSCPRFQRSFAPGRRSTELASRFLQQNTAQWWTCRSSEAREPVSPSPCFPALASAECPLSSLLHGACFSLRVEDSFSPLAHILLIFQLSPGLRMRLQLTKARRFTIEVGIVSAVMSSSAFNEGLEEWVIFFYPKLATWLQIVGEGRRSCGELGSVLVEDLMSAEDEGRGVRTQPSCAFGSLVVSQSGPRAWKQIPYVT